MNQRVEVGPGTYPVRNLATGVVTSLVVPTLTVAVSPSTPSVGQVLSLTTNAAAGATYRWRRGASDIAGATGATYLAQAADEGQTVSCQVTSGAQVITSAGVTVGASTATFRVDRRGAGRVLGGPIGSPMSLTGLAIGPASERDRVYVLAQIDANGEDPVTLSMNGASGTSIANLRPTSAFSRNTQLLLFRFTPVGDNPVTLTASGPASYEGMHAVVWSARAVGSENLATDVEPTNGLLDVSQAVNAGDVLVGGAHFKHPDGATSWVDTGNITTVGLTEWQDRLIDPAFRFGASAVVAADHSAVSGQALRTMTFTCPPTVRHSVALSLRLRA